MLMMRQTERVERARPLVGRAERKLSHEQAILCSLLFIKHSFHFIGLDLAKRLSSVFCDEM